MSMGGEMRGGGGKGRVRNREKVPSKILSARDRGVYISPPPFFDSFLSILELQCHFLHTYKTSFLYCIYNILAILIITYLDI